MYLVFSHLADLSLQFDLQSLNGSSQLSDLRLCCLQSLSPHSHLFAYLSRLSITSIDTIEGTSLTFGPVVRPNKTSKEFSLFASVDILNKQQIK